MSEEKKVSQTSQKKSESHKSQKKSESPKVIPEAKLAYVMDSVEQLSKKKDTSS